MVSMPSSVNLSAVSGSSAVRASRVPEACPTARILSQCPKSMTVTSKTSSHHKSGSKNPAVVAALATNATVSAMPIKSIMPGRHSRASSKLPFRNG